MNKAKRMRGDSILLTLVALAALIGAFVIWDVTYPESIARGEGPVPKDLLKHLIGLAVAAAAFVAVSRMRPDRIRRFSGIFFAVVFVCCALVLVPGFGITAGGATRWLGYGPLSFQPAELFKVALVVFLAAYACVKLPSFGRKRRDIWEKLDSCVIPAIPRIFPFAILLVAFIIIEMEPDLGTAAMTLVIAFGMLLFGLGRKLLGNYTAAIMIGMVAVGAVGMGMLAMNKGYRMERLATHLHRWDPAMIDGPGYQSAQAELAMAVGGPGGVGVGQGRAKHVLPAAKTDFIFVTIVEEFGIIGSLTVIVLLGGISLRLIWLSSEADDEFRRLVLAGTGWWIGAQSIANMLMAAAALPAIGLPLPFFSYGSSSLLALAIALGVCASALSKKLPEAQREISRNRRRYRRTRLSGA